MALTSAQCAAARMYLGYERGFDMHPYLEGKLLAFSSDEETQVVAVLAKLSALDTRMDTVATNGSLEAKSADGGEIELRDGDPLTLYAAQGRRLVARLAILCGVQPLHDYYSAAGSNGGVIPLG